MSAAELSGRERSGEDPLRVVDLTGSTNDDARELALAGAPAGFAVAARRQTAGRGRRGHRWESADPTLCVSVVLRPRLPMSFFGAVPAVAVLGVLRALRGATGLGTRLGLKWPNDVVAFGPGYEAGATDGRKLGGMLVEAGHDGSGAFAVAGQGVNLWSGSLGGAPRPDGRAGAGGHAAAAAPGGTTGPAPLPAVSLEELVGAGAVPEFEELAEQVRLGMVLAVGEWEARAKASPQAPSSPLAPMLDEYQDCVAALGHRVTAYSPQGTPVARGVFSGVDGWGRACILADGGRELKLTSEQASLRVEC